MVVKPPELEVFGVCRSSNNGDDRARTDGLRLARAALSQLSYIPLVLFW